MKREKVLWGIFWLDVGVLSVSVLMDLLKQDVYGQEISVLVLSLPVILLIFHSFWTLGVERGVAFFLMSALTGLGFEIVGLKIGVVFGGHYVYSPSKLMIMNVPVSVPIYWAVFVYTGYTIVNSFRLWLGKDKPSKHKNSLVPRRAGRESMVRASALGRGLKGSLLGIRAPFIQLIKLIVLDGLIVVAIDMFMDPLMVRAGRWAWLESGPYFGVPIGNFIGWFIVVAVSTGTFRLYEFLHPLRIKKINKSVFLIPVFGYGLMAVSFVILAIEYQMYSLLLIGSLLMFPVCLSNLFLYSRFRISKKAAV